MLNNLKIGDLVLVNGCKGLAYPNGETYIPFIVNKYALQNPKEYFAGWSEIKVYRKSKSGRTYKLIYISK